MTRRLPVLHLGDDRHPGRQLHGLAADHEPLLPERDARGTDWPAGALDIGRLIARGLRALAALLLVLRLVDRIARDALDAASIA